MPTSVTPTRRRAEFEESLTLFVEFGDRWFGGIVLESAAFWRLTTGDAERAVHLLAAADAIRTALEVPLWVGFRERHERVLAEAPSIGRDALRCGVEGRPEDPLADTLDGRPGTQGRAS